MIDHIIKEKEERKEVDRSIDSSIVDTTPSLVEATPSLVAETLSDTEYLKRGNQLINNNVFYLKKYRKDRKVQ